MWRQCDDLKRIAHVVVHQLNHLQALPNAFSASAFVGDDENYYKSGGNNVVRKQQFSFKTEPGGDVIATGSEHQKQQCPKDRLKRDPAEEAVVFRLIKWHV